MEDRTRERLLRAMELAGYSPCGAPTRDGAAVEGWSSWVRTLQVGEGRPWQVFLHLDPRGHLHYSPGNDLENAGRLSQAWTTHWVARWLGEKIY